MIPNKTEIVYFMKCLAGLKNGDQLLKDGNDDLAEEWFRKTLELAGSAPPEIARDLVPYTLCILSGTYRRIGKTARSREIWERAVSLLDSNNEHLESAFFNLSMANTLTGLGDFRRAIPFWEKALQLMEDDENAQALAEMLHKLGVCYCRIGLREHALVPLRSTLKILESCPEHPMRPGVLLTLGNALRKSAPAEAEACYREAAEYYASRLQHESATPAWSNLAILCSDQGRHSEALELQLRVLHVREKSVDARPSSIALVYNNIANTYRKMGEIDRAFDNVNRAIDSFPSTDSDRACAYSTLAMILREAGQDAEAVEWFQKAFAARGEQASSNLESIADDLEGEIALLLKLGRNDEANEAQARLADIHYEMQETPPSKGVDSTKGLTGGIVIVELGFGRIQQRLSGVETLQPLVAKMSEMVESEKIGELSGNITIPESTTLIFNGPDAEGIFAVLEPLLKSQPIGAGARITIRQGASCRESVISHPSAGVN
jgi:tetratricopeptide (TPR) repeat protein